MSAYGASSVGDECMPSTSPMPPKNLATVRISDRSTETQTQTGYPSIPSGGLTPRSPVLALGSSCCAPGARSGRSSRRPARVGRPPLAAVVARRSPRSGRLRDARACCSGSLTGCEIVGFDVAPV
jgi:hypothetical protein